MSPPKRRYAPPPPEGASALGRPGGAQSLNLATLARRLAALIYESLLLVAVVFAANFALLPLVTPSRAGKAAELVVPALPERVALFWLMFAVLAAYFVWCWSNGRRTLAMKTWRLALARRDGGAVTPRSALARYLACWIGPGLALGAYAVLSLYGYGAHAAWLVAFNFLWAFVDRERQFLHDRVAGTRIVNDGATG
ncbi:MAG: RDD family protein [Burkholderiales bacterium]|nr:RDD family protein [Burkholderiales bacterium]